MIEDEDADSNDSEIVRMPGQIVERESVRRLPL
jgi:hypothetical protein